MNFKYILIFLIVYLSNNYVNSKEIKNKLFFENHLIESNVRNKTSDKFLTNETKEYMNRSLGFTEEKFTKFNEFGSEISQNLLVIEENLKRSAIQFIYSLNLTNDCLSAVFRWFHGLKTAEFWAYQLFDSNGRIPSGLTGGLISSFGEYDQCLGISSQTTDPTNSEQIIYGKYCLVKPILPINDFKSLQNFNGIQLLNNITNEWIKKEIKENINKLKLLMSVNQLTDKLYAFYLGICIPSQCQPKDVENVLKAVVQPILPIPIEVGAKCDTINDEIEWSLFNISFMSLPVLLSLLIIVSTLYSLKYQNLSQQKNIYFHEIMKSFSLMESNKRLFSPFKDRFLIVELLILWIVLWHCAGMAYGMLVTSGGIGYKKLLDSFTIHILTDSKYFWLRTSFPRDTLFFLCGFIISVDFFAKKIRISFLSYLKFVLEKWYRFLPKMIGAIVLSTILLNFGDGPFFSMRVNKNVCPQKFWLNLLFINQFVNDIIDVCTPMTWIYSVIFQLQIIAPIFMAPFIKSLKFGLTFNSVAIIVFSFLKIIPKLFFRFELIPFEISKLNSVKDMKQIFAHNMIFTDQYINIFIFGIIFGYILRKRPQLIDRMIKTRPRIIFFSIISYSLSFLSILWSENFKDINEEKNDLNLIAWFVLGNFLWSAGIIWTVFLFYKIKHGPFYGIISNSLFCAIYRLSLSIAVNFGVLTSLLSVMNRDNLEASHINQIKNIYINMSLTLIACYLIYISLEYPFIHILEISKNKRNVILCQNDVNVKQNVNETSQNINDNRETIFN